MFQCSSASRKFLNDLRHHAGARVARVSVLFSEPKIPQLTATSAGASRCRRFSALQRAENSSIAKSAPTNDIGFALFQCSSASRKFLNPFGVPASTARPRFSVLFSEPKIPQCGSKSVFALNPTPFQCSSASRKFLNQTLLTTAILDLLRFSALQRAENSSMNDLSDYVTVEFEFQCSSASRKFLNHHSARSRNPDRRFQCSSASRKFLNRDSTRWGRR